MLRRILLLVGLLNLAVFSSVSPAAGKAETYHYKYHGLLANAYFSITDESGCIETTAHLTAGDGYRRYDKQLNSDSRIHVFVYKYDNCASDYLFAVWGGGVITNDAFTIKQQLNTAELKTTVILEEWKTREMVPVEIHITWTATGEGFNEKFHDRYYEPGYKRFLHSIGFIQPAVASGSIISLDTNFSELPSLSAELSNDKYGFVEIIMSP